MFLAVSAIFLVDLVGLSAHQAGLGLSLGGAIALLTTLPVGALADRFGPRRVLTIVTLWRGACYAAYPLIHDFPAFLVLVCFLGPVERTAGPLTQAIVGQAVPDADRVSAMAMLRSLRNVGFTLGALFGSLVLAVGTRLAYDAVMLANAASFVVMALIVIRLPLAGSPHPTRRRAGSPLQVLADRPYLGLAALNSVLAAHRTLLVLGIPIWIAEHTDAPKAIVAPLIGLNTVLAIAFQLRASRGTDTVAGAAACMRRAGLCVMACCVILAIIPSLPVDVAVFLLIAAMVMLTAGELLQSAGGWALSFALAPVERQATYLSVFGMSITVQEIVAPTLILVGVMGLGRAGWLAFGALVAAAGLVVSSVARQSLGQHHQTA